MTKDKKIFLLKLFIIIFFLTISVYFFSIVIKNKIVSHNFEEEVITLSEYHLKNNFSLNKIIVYSSAIANTNIGINSSNYDINLSRLFRYCYIY